MNGTMRSLVCGAGAVLLADATSAWGQAAESTGGLQDIVVTARRQSERLQTVPISVSAISAQTMERMNIQNVDRVGQIMPNVAITPIVGSPGGNIAFIRGIGNSDPQSSLDPPVGEYLDGVYIGRGMAGNFELVDLERIEVLRGPQGTLFGRNTTGGAINIVTKTPGRDFGFEQRLGYASFNEWYSRSKIETGELGGSGITAALTFLHRQRDGYVDNPGVPARDGPGAFDTNALWARVHGGWGALTLDYSFDYSLGHSRPAPFQIGYVSPAVGAYYANSPSLGGSMLVVDPDGRLDTLAVADVPSQRLRVSGHALTLQYELSPQATFKSITGYRNYKKTGPLPYGPDGLRGQTAAGVQDVIFNISRGNQRQHQWSEELQLLGKIDQFSYIFGLYYFHEKADDDTLTQFTIVRNGIGTPALSRNVFTSRGTSYAAFGQVAFRPHFLDDKFELAAGLRQSWDRKSIDQTFASVRQDHVRSGRFNYNVTATYRWTPDVTTYARIGTGYRSGGFNSRAADIRLLRFKPEKALAYEAGLKSEFFDRRLRINGALFYTKYDNLQVTQFIGNTGVGTSGFTLNANATYRGGELEIQALPVDGLTLYANSGYTRAKYKEIYFINPATGFLENYASVAKFPYVPRWTVAAGADYTSPPTGIGRVTARLDYTWTSRRYFHTINLPTVNPFNDQIADPGHAVVNARIGLVEIPVGNDRTRLEVGLWVENLFDRDYRQMGIDFGPTLGFAGNVYGLPRRIGVDAKIGF